MEREKREYRSAVRSRERILEALAEFLKEKPLEKITVQEVAARADVNRSTFYAHFDNVPNVIHRRVGEANHAIARVISSNAREGEVPDPGFMLTAFADLFSENESFWHAVFSSGIGTDLLEQVRSYFADYAEQAWPSRFAKDPVQRRVQISAITGCAAGLYRDWLTGKLPLPLSAFTASAADTLRQVLATILAQKGKTWREPNPSRSFDMHQFYAHFWSRAARSR